jgi:N-hydroxyarylamine O-acetyltransferase
VRVPEFDLNRYLTRLGVRDPGRPGIEELSALHRAHVERVPYENLEIQLGRPTSISPVESAWRIGRGRGGYCYHLNGAFSLLLRALGYAVRWHKAGIQAHGQIRPPGATGNHLALTVHSLPGRDNPEGMWLVDVGLGDALHRPLPLRPGEFADGPFQFGLEPSTVEFLGWRLRHHPYGSFEGMDFRADEATERDFEQMHTWLSTAPESGFVRVATVQRRDAHGVDLLRGRVLQRLPGGYPVELTSAAQWYGALADVFGLRLDDVPADDRATLWRRVSVAHDAWLSAGDAAG